jgi:membrane protein YdbS with pleckstrin-like domain
MPEARAVERIGLQRAVAMITSDAIAIRPSRASLVGPAVQALIALTAVWAVVAFINVLPLWVLMVLLVFALIAGPTAILGLVYNVAGSSFLMERAKQSARWQQGFLGLGIGTRELVPFWRIQRIEVAGDFEAELGSGDLQDIVRWEVRLVKDNDRMLEVAAVAGARPLADEALDRANALARALGEMAGAEVREATLPAWALEEREEDDPVGSGTLQGPR